VIPFSQTFSHGKSSVIRFIYRSAHDRKGGGKLTITYVEEYKLGPEMSLLSSLDDFGLNVSSHHSTKGGTDDITSLPEQFEVLHDYSSAVFLRKRKK
jgi:hypothetical protein